MLLMTNRKIRGSGVQEVEAVTCARTFRRLPSQLIDGVEETQHQPSFLLRCLRDDDDMSSSTAADPYQQF